MEQSNISQLKTSELTAAESLKRRSKGPSLTTSEACGAIFTTHSGSTEALKENAIKPIETILDIKKHSFASFIEGLKEESEPCFLFQPSVDEKLLPPIRHDRNYTLVLDLDETLIHCQQDAEGNGVFLIRPQAQDFLRMVSRYFEVVIFTAATQDYADAILNRLDSGHEWIDHRLYRDHTSFYNNTYHKDLTRLGRCLSKTIIVDNNADNFRLQPSNGIYIKSWYGDLHDTALRQLAPILIRIVTHHLEKDVRHVLKILKEESTHQTRVSTTMGSPLRVQHLL